MILKKADASGNSVPFKAAEFRGHDSYPALSALEDINQSAIILFHPFYGTVECKWLSGGEYVTLFRIHPHETGLSEKNGITVPIGKLIFGVEDEAACLERLRAEMFEAVQTLAFEGTKLPGLSPLQSTRNFWATQADLIGGMCGIPEDPRGKPHRPNYEAYAKKAAARFFIIAKLNEAIRILSSSALLTASKAA